MNCDPGYLMDQARCFRCIPKGELRSVAINLLVQWANNAVTELVTWTPDSKSCLYSTVADPFVILPATLAQFQALDPTTIYSLDLGGGVPPQCTSLTGVQLMTNINSISIVINSLDSLDVSGNTSLSLLDVSDGAITSLDVSGCLGLTSLTANFNALTSITGLATCSNLVGLVCYNNDFVSLDLTGLNNLAFLNLGACSLLTTITLSGSENVVYVNDCLIASLNVSGNTSIVELNCQNQGGGGMTSLNVTGCTSLNMLWCFANDLGSLDLSGCTNLIDLQAYLAGLSGVNAITNLTDCTLITSIIIYDNDLSLSGLDLSAASSLVYLDCVTCQLQSLDIGDSPNLFICNASFNDLGTFVADNNPSLQELYINDQTTGLGGNLDVSTSDQMIIIVANNADVQGLILAPASASLGSIYLDGNVNLLTLDLTNAQNLIEIICFACSSLNSINLGIGTSYGIVNCNSCDLPTAQVDYILSYLLANCCANAGTCDLSGGTNGAPTLSCITPGSPCDDLINLCLWSVSTN